MLPKLRKGGHKVCYVAALTALPNLARWRVLLFMQKRNGNFRASSDNICVISNVSS